MQRAYICAPYRAQTVEGILLNIRTAKQFGFFISRMANSTECFVPHTYVQEKYGVKVEYNHGEMDAKIAADLMAKLDECNILYVCGTTITAGMLAEINRMRSLGRPICMVDISWLEQAKEIISKLDPDARNYA